MTTRAVQASMWPDIAPSRPIGPLPMSVQVGTNAELIAKIAPIYLTGSVLDVTYGRGGWWRNYQPDPFTFHDLALDGVDFRALPEQDNNVDTVCFDPPYVPAGGVRSSGATRDEADYRDRFGLTPRSRDDLNQLIAAGLAECARVTRRWLLTKCCDYVSGGKFYLGHLDLIDAAAACGLRPWDLIVHHTGSGPGGHNITVPLRARRAHSYLIVFNVRAA